jgi:anti-anti-sigma factor
MCSQIEATSAVRRLTLQGELTIHHAAHLKSTLLEALSCATLIELDVSRVTEIDTAGLQLLLATKRQAGRQACRLKLIDPSPAVLEMIELFSLDALLREAS